MKNQYKNNIWNPWTKKSKNIKFKSSILAVGDGEEKLGAEFNTVPLGQNVSYDLLVFGEKWEVKKLDSDNSFRLGVEVASNYRLIIDSVIRILENVLQLENILINSKKSNQIKNYINLIKSNTGRSSTLLISGLRRNEVSASNLSKANDLIENLKKLLIAENFSVKMFSSYDGLEGNYDILNAFRKLEFEDISIENKLSKLECDIEFYTRLQLTSKIFDDIIIFKDISLKEKLNELVRSIFTDIKLVLVHKDKGFKPITDMDLFYCNRITSGNPRCKLY
ncbi:hypothetical protein GO491_00280 [Flavobacteriaceae bacterium Ap0902]|nr:hypothetical protein [Flavobacteriaceae bacterium Ap0902]